MVIDKVFRVRGQWYKKKLKHGFFKHHVSAVSNLQLIPLVFMFQMKTKNYVVDRIEEMNKRFVYIEVELDSREANCPNFGAKHRRASDID